MLANVLPLHTPLDPRVGSKCHFFPFLKVVMLHVKLTTMKQRTQCRQIFCPFIHPQPPPPPPPDMGSKGQNHLFFEEGHVAYPIKGKEV